MQVDLCRAGRFAQIRVPREPEIALLAEAAVGADLPWQWRGYAPSTEAFRRTFWEGVLANWVIIRRSSQELAGHVSFYGANAANQYCFVQAWVDGKYRRLGWPFEGVALAIDSVFTRYPMRKIYIEAVDVDLSQYSSILRLPGIEAEGCLRAHTFVAGRYRDVHLVAIYRDRWAEVLTRFRTTAAWQ